MLQGVYPEDDFLLYAKGTSQLGTVFFFGFPGKSISMGITWNLIAPSNMDINIFLSNTYEKIISKFGKL